MNYKIQKIEQFKIIMLETELSNKRNSNIRQSTQFWKEFNKHLKSSNLSQTHSWLKYAFMQRRDGTLLYGCAIPYKDIIPENFTFKNIPANTYLVFEHIGSLDKIYETYDKIYKEFLPTNNYVLAQTDFLHFEKYNSRFHWNRADSIIEIWVPIQPLSSF